MKNKDLLQIHYDEYIEQEEEFPPLLVGEKGDDECSSVEFLDFPTFRLSDNQIIDILKILKVGAKRRQDYINR